MESLLGMANGGMCPPCGNLWRSESSRAARRREADHLRPRLVLGKPRAGVHLDVGQVALDGEGVEAIVAVVHVDELDRLEPKGSV